MKSEEGFLLLFKGLLQVACLLFQTVLNSIEKAREIQPPHLKWRKNNTLFTTPIYNVIFPTFCFSTLFVTISLLIFWKIC